MFKWIFSLVLVFCLLVVPTNLSDALEPESKPVNHLFKVPTSKSGNQWSVTIGQANLDGRAIKPVLQKYDVYSLSIKNIGETVYNVRVEAYKALPDEQTKLRLFSVPVKSEFLNGEGMTVHQNFPIGLDAKELEINVYWEIKQDYGSKVNGINVTRTWKNSFSFKPDSQQP
ncbi:MULTISPECIES: hypothetical protein [unclassified Brevibacillus]|uniref:hypothetical protein n=1 Tax=unclassified Brevibacillus TaxID=2684853 RepID=UPI00356933B9